MTSFTFQTAGEIAFGRGVSARASGVLAQKSKRVLAVHGSRVQAASWLIDALQGQGVSVTTASCSGEPTLETVQATVGLAREADVGAVVALGGGSVIDMGKAVAGLVASSRPLLDHLEVVGAGLPLDSAGLFFVAIPTTAGTGAEVTKNAVIGVPNEGRKISLRSPYLLPDLALVDPALTDGAPQLVTMGSGLDAVTQVIEAYVSCKATSLTDALCRDAIAPGLRALQTLAREECPHARDAIAHTSLIGGLVLANAGLGSVHGLAGVIGGQTGAPHGQICAALLPHVLAENTRLAPERSVAQTKLRFVQVQLADELGVDAQDCWLALVAWMRACNAPSLRALGVQPPDIEQIAKSAVGASSTKGNPVPFGYESFCRVLEAALGVIG
jgi:alcohol dehydrogenase class IV